MSAAGMGMSGFARTALDMFHSAEQALSGDPYTREGAGSSGSPYAGGKAIPGAAIADAARSEPWGLELSRQLQAALGEIVALRSEWAAEREARQGALVALGRRWKEEMRVEMRAGEYAQRREFAALAQSVQDKAKAEAVELAVRKRELEALSHAVRAQKSLAFDHAEALREEVEAMRGRVDAAFAQSAALRLEVVQTMEKEKAALAARLEQELLRGEDRHHEDVKQIQSLKAYVREEMQAARATIRDLVHETWGSFAATLEREVRETQNGWMDELKRTGERVRSVEAAVEESARAHQVEIRAQSTMLRDRVAALESNEAVLAARMDRAEKKADAAHESTARTDAAVLIAREMVERASGLSQRAAERAQRVEDVLLDRDARLVQVESQLHLATTSGNLKAAVEACGRGLNHLESRVGALSDVCARCESLVEASGGKTDAILARLSQCEKASTTSKNAVQGIMESVQGVVDRLVTVEDARERLQGAADQQELARVRLEHRLDASENRMKLLTEKHAQFQKELLAQHHTLSARLEESYELTSRSESISAAGKADVERLEKRLIKLESTMLGFLERCDAAQAGVEEVNREIAAIQRQSAQIKEKIDHSNRNDVKLEALERLETDILERSRELEKDVNFRLEQLKRHTEKTAERLETYLKDTIEQHADAMGEQVQEVVRKAEGRCGKFAKELLAVHDRVEEMEQGVGVFGEFLEHHADQYVSKTELDALRRGLSSSQAQLRGQRARTTRELRETRRRIEMGERRLKMHDREVDRLKVTLQGSQQGFLDNRAADAVRHEELSRGSAPQHRNSSGPTENLSESLPARRAVGVVSTPPAEWAEAATGGNSPPEILYSSSLGRPVRDPSLISAQTVGTVSNSSVFQQVAEVGTALPVEELLSSRADPSPSTMVSYFSPESPITRQESVPVFYSTNNNSTCEDSSDVNVEKVPQGAARSASDATDNPSWLASEIDSVVVGRIPPSEPLPGPSVGSPTSFKGQPIHAVDAAPQLADDAEEERAGGPSAGSRATGPAGIPTAVASVFDPTPSTTSPERSRARYDWDASDDEEEKNDEDDDGKGNDASGMDDATPIHLVQDAAAAPPGPGANPNDDSFVEASLGSSSLGPASPRDPTRRAAAFAVADGPAREDTADAASPGAGPGMQAGAHPPSSSPRDVARRYASFDDSSSDGSS